MKRIAILHAPIVLYAEMVLVKSRKEEHVAVAPAIVEFVIMTFASTADSALAGFVAAIAVQNRAPAQPISILPAMAAMDGRYTAYAVMAALQTNAFTPPAQPAQ